VLQIEGTVSPSFRWIDAARTDDPRGVLRAEGVEFDRSGRANLVEHLAWFYQRAQMHTSDIVLTV
jgi:hypothetical protein